MRDATKTIEALRAMLKGLAEGRGAHPDDGGATAGIRAGLGHLLHPDQTVLAGPEHRQRGTQEQNSRQPLSPRP